MVTGNQSKLRRSICGGMKLTISDASSERLWFSALLCKGVIVWLAGDGKVDTWHCLHLRLRQHTRSIPPHIYARQMKQPGQHQERKMNRGSSHTMTPSAGLWQTFLGRAPSRTLKALSSSSVNYGPGAPMRQVCVPAYTATRRWLTNEEKCQDQDYKHIGVFWQSSA